MKRINKRAFVCVLAIAIFGSCKKDIRSATDVRLASTTKAAIPVFPFSWETADFVPTPAGDPVLVPWASGANQEYDAADMAFDFRSSDGWVLVYNTFNTTALTNPQFFALYNVYRGLYRLYVYFPSSVPTPSNYLQESLQLVGGASSSLLNFCGQDLVDVSTNLTGTTTIAPYTTEASGAWYVLQFEMAYDPNIPNIAYQSLQTAWNLQSVNVTQNTLDGTQNGTLNGTITTPAPSFNFAGALITGALDVAGLGALSALGTAIPAAIKSAATSGVNMSLSGTVKNVLNAVVGGSSASTQQVNLTLNTTIALTGTATSNFPLANPTLIVPGTIWDPNTTTAGYVPGYNKPLGVFNISAKPTVTLHKVNHSNGTITGSTTTYSYTLNSASYQVEFNPAVTALATIQNLKTDFLLLVPPTSSPMFPASYEQIGNRGAYANVTGFTVPFGQLFLGIPAVRISFDVVPNNGAPSSKIIKTFATTLTTM